MKTDNLRILILEPNALQRSLLKVALTRHGMTPLICKSADDLRNDLFELQPDALIIDTHLNGKNGLSLISQLEESRSLQNTRIFFISSLGYAEVVQKAVQLGASGFLVKPLDTDLLVQRITQSYQAVF
jgi:DNA-binding response OmpR family regulator